MIFANKLRVVVGQGVIIPKNNRGSLSTARKALR